MPRMSKKDKLYWAFFIDPATGRRKFNRICRCCTHSCMQSFRAELICCPDYLGKRSKAGRTGSEAGKQKGSKSKEIGPKKVFDGETLEGGMQEAIQSKKQPEYATKRNKKTGGHPRFSGDPLPTGI